MDRTLRYLLGGLAATYVSWLLHAAEHELETTDERVAELEQQLREARAAIAEDRARAWADEQEQT